MWKHIHVKYPLFLSDFNEIFRYIFSRKAQILNLFKICPVEAELFHADGQTDGDMTKLIVAFRNFANAPKKYIKRKN